MRRLHLLLFSTIVVFLSGCDRSAREGDLLFIGYRYTPENNAYVSADSKKYMGDGYATSLNASPHVRIYGSMCDLTWVETEPDGSKKTKHMSFPVSNIYELVWKGD